MSRFASTPTWAVHLDSHGLGQRRVLGPFDSMTAAKAHMREQHGERTWKRDWNGTDWVGDCWYLTPKEPKQ